MIRRIFPLLVFVLAGASPALADPISQIVVFGDSLSDQGNAFIITGGAFPPAPYAMRASNGPVAAEVLAANLGVALAPALAGGTNYAVVGAATGPIAAAGGIDNSAVITYGVAALNGTGMFQQGNLYLAGGPVIDSAGTLFLVWGGANDFLLDFSATAAADAVNNLALLINDLYNAGARRFLVPNLGDLSLTPFGQTQPPGDRAVLQALTVGFNAGLETALSSLDALPGIDITRFNTFAFLSALVSNPAAFGFTNATDPCLSGDFGSGVDVCANPDSHVFWDTVHPTAAAHAALGNALAKAVPEPATLSLIGVGLALHAIRRARRTRR
jgi:outer membrane lipase/esterase